MNKTARERVLAVYKQAEVHEWDDKWIIYFDAYCMGIGATVRAAWADAAKRLKEGK